jgi:hypothetical protein
MSKQTAVEWLIEQIQNRQNGVIKDLPVLSLDQIFEQAKAMEKEQITKTARQCHFEGVRQSAKTSEEYIAYGEQYYNQTYGGTND